MTDRSNSSFSPIAAPGPAPWHMLSAIGQLRHDPLAWLVESFARYGDTVALPMDGPCAVVLNTPAAAADVLVRHADVCTKQTIQYSSLQTLTGVGLLTSDGAAWRVPRGVVQPAFHKPRLVQVAQAAVRQAGELAAACSARAVVDVEPLALKATMGVVAETVLGSADSTIGDQLVTEVLRALPVVVRRSQVPTPLWLPTPGVLALRRANRALDAVCADVVAYGQRHPDQVQGTVLGNLLTALAAGELTQEQVRAELVTMIIAGHETVATSLTWTLGLLGHHSATQAKVHAELDAVLQGRLPCFDDVPKLSFLHAVVCESLRLYPPAWAVSRRTTASVMCGEVQVPENTVVVVSPWVLGRRMDVFDRADEFVPERFLAPLTAAQRMAFIPFGAGRRLCIGKDFALTEQVLMLATMLQKHRVDAATLGSLPGAKPEVTIRPVGGMPLSLSPRVTSASLVEQQR